MFAIIDRKGTRNLEGFTDILQQLSPARKFRAADLADSRQRNANLSTRQNRAQVLQQHTPQA